MKQNEPKAKKYLFINAKGIPGLLFAVLIFSSSDASLMKIHLLHCPSVYYIWYKCCFESVSYIFIVLVSCILSHVLIFSAGLTFAYSLA